jgi:hypothetical protein
LRMSGRAVRSSSALAFWVGFSFIGDPIGWTLELDECRVIGGVLSLPLERFDDPVESFLAIAAISAWDIIFVGEL